MKYSKIQARQIVHRLEQYLNEFKFFFKIKQTIFITVFNFKELINCVCMYINGERKWEREVEN